MSSGRTLPGWGRRSFGSPDLDIYRPASVLVKQHGKDAPIEAAMRANAMLDKGDLDGFSMWKRILWAVEELQRVEAGPGVAVH